ncbi:MAG: hypothetical protein KGL74_12500 [Elusimicrobia bacterium]|nr:hypothetical protein [Elusimicrobiota bacterium]MDE2511934.1 hypothetical protein [Elusimicrobiota bacterium]
MKTTTIRVLTALFILGAAVRASAAGVRDVGVGIILGEPIGGTAKFWLDDRFALDAGAGFSDGNAGFWGDALWHDWTLLPQPKDGRLAAYAGGGPQVRTGVDARFGIRAVVGAAYRPSKQPLEFFLEAGPLFRLTQGGGVDAVGGVGVRLYGWGGAKS